MLPDFATRLTLSDLKYQEIVRSFWDFLLKTDGYTEDVSANFLKNPAKMVELKIYSKSDTYVSGLEELLVLQEILEGVQIDLLCQDGDLVSAGTLMLIVKGRYKSLLSLERTLLNYLTHMLALTNLGSKYVQLIDKFKNPVRLASTRKGILPVFAKKALSVAGILTHRLSLGEAVMFKDNHLENLNFDKLLESDFSEVNFVEFEFDSLSQISSRIDFLNSFFAKNKGGIMLDNFLVTDLKKALIFLEEMREVDFFIEVSGGVNYENLAQFDLAGIDFVSLSEFNYYNKVPDLTGVIDC